MERYFKLYMIAGFVFLVIDMVWLNVIAKDLYQKNIGHLMGSVNIVAAIVFYMIYIAGIVHFVLIPNTDPVDWKALLINGAFLGLLCYATYDLTNLATLREWPVSLTLIDLIWGASVTAATVGITALIHTFLEKGALW